MNISNAKVVYAFFCFILGLVILLPALSVVVSLPSEERFSELWLLGPNHMAENYPFNISPAESYKVYLGVGNQMDSLSYYRVIVKLRNASEPSPHSTRGLPSPLTPIFEYNVFLKNNETWEKDFTFSFDDVTFEDDSCRVSKVLIGDYAVDVSKTAVWNATSSTFAYQLFFELWLYDAASSRFQFHNRCVGFWLNISQQL